MTAAFRIVRKFVEAGRVEKGNTQMPGTTIQQAQNAGYLKLAVALPSAAFSPSLSLCLALAQLKVEWQKV